MAGPFGRTDIRMTMMVIPTCDCVAEAWIRRQGHYSESLADIIYLPDPTSATS
jgi:hypothetical protein